MKNSIVQRVILVFCTYLFLNFLCLWNIYATVIVEDSNIYDENVNVNILVSNIFNEILKLPDGEDLEYDFKINFIPNTNKLDKLKVIQKDMIERLDAILTVTPNFKMTVYENKVKINIKPYTIKDLDYDNLLNSLVKEASSKESDFDKLYVLANYLYTNEYIYDYNNNIEFSNVRASNISENPNCMPDGVISRKKGVCEGYSNLMTDFCERLGIPCLKLRGYNFENGYHVWNLAYLENNGFFNWYCVEPLVSLHKLNNTRLIQIPIVFKDAEKMRWDSILEQDIKNLKYSEIDLKFVESENYFLDIDTFWGKRDIIKLYINGIVSGYSDRTFRPYNDITIAEFLKIVLKPYMLELPINNEKVWWEDSYYYALDNGIIDETLFPKESIFDNITREQMAYIFVNVDRKLNNNEDIEIPKEFSIVDEDSISELFRSYVYQSYLKGFMQGIDEIGTFNPKGYATRGQVAVIMSRLLDKQDVISWGSINI